jgi:single-strand DNA-binding protein
VNGPQITVVGHVGGSPRLRTLTDGTFVTDFRVAMTPSRFDKATGAWVDQPTEWFSVTCWRSLAEHAAMSFHKGHKVIVTGTFSTRTWKDKDGVERVSSEIEATSVGMDVTRGPVQQKRFERTETVDDDKRRDPWVDESVALDPETGELIPGQVAPDQVAA